MALVPQVVDVVSPIPVVAAGGIFDGRGIAAGTCITKLSKIEHVAAAFCRLLPSGFKHQLRFVYDAVFGVAHADGKPARVWKERPRL
jgi:hypothetical protein